jgi:hypothetical protein
MSRLAAPELRFLFSSCVAQALMGRIQYLPCTVRSFMARPIVGLMLKLRQNYEISQMLPYGPSAVQTLLVPTDPARFSTVT